jgi:hypothetical protein
VDGVAVEGAERLGVAAFLEQALGLERVDVAAGSGAARSRDRG